MLIFVVGTVPVWKELFQETTQHRIQITVIMIVDTLKLVTIPLELALQALLAIVLGGKFVMLSVIVILFMGRFVTKVV
jgi:hypothetical protein